MNATEPAATSRWGNPARIVDAHNDLLAELTWRGAEPAPFRDRWLEQLTAGGVALQVCPLYVWWHDIGDSGLRCGLEQVAAFLRATDENPEVARIGSREQLDAAIARDQLGLMLSIEGAEVIGSDPGMLAIYHQLGVRMIGLTHFQRNAYADGNGEPSHGGLSGLGRELVRRIDALGMMLDLAHASDGTFQDVLDTSERAALVVSHTACRALADDQRNVTDAQLRALAERDGVVGIFVCPYFIGGERNSVERVVDHVVHALEVAGPEHVGLGGDFTRQLYDVPGLIRAAPWMDFDIEKAREIVDGMAGPAGYPLLVDALQRRGVTGDVLAGVLHGNFLRAFRAALPHTSEESS
ncbi:MAG TPA: membrane dipeptidase [Conexibacter sp.]|nr:membrane dipeptidase [Conexibacter sp.]